MICRQCDLNLPQRVPTTPEGKNSEVWDTQLSSKRPLEPSPSPNDPSQKKIATPCDSSFSTPHKAIAFKALFFATPSSNSKSKEPPMARELKALLSQLEEWQMARPEADLLEDLEEAKEVDWRCHGWVEEELLFCGESMVKGHTFGCHGTRGISHTIWKVLMLLLEGFDALTVATGGRPKVFLNVPLPQKMDVGDRQIWRRANLMRDFMEWTSQGDTPDLGRLTSKVYKGVKPREHVVMKVPKFGTLHMATSLAFSENQLRGLRSFLNRWGDNFLDSWRVLAAQRE